MVGALALALAACGGGGDGSPDAVGADAAGPDAAAVTVYNYLGGFGQSRVVRTRLAGGAEMLHGETLFDGGATFGVQLRVIEDVELAPDGRLARADLQLWHTLGTTEFHRRDVYDATTGLIQVTRDGGQLEWTAPTDAPWRYYPIPTDVYFWTAASSPVAAWVTARASALGGQNRYVEAETMYSLTFAATADVISTEGGVTTFGNYGDQFIWDGDAITEVTNGFTGIPMTKITDDLGEDLLDFTVAAGTEAPLRVPTCEIPGTAEEVTLTSADGTTLHGTVNVPPGAGPFPFIAFATGAFSGCDRDCAVRFGIGATTCRAKGWVEGGVGVLRIDERTTGTSGGTREGLSFATRAEDTAAMATYLATRADAKPNATFVYTLGFGATIAADAVALAPDDIDGIILENANADPGATVDLEQTRIPERLYGMPSAIGDRQRMGREDFQEQILTDTYPTATTPAGYATGYIKEFFVRDPAAALVAAARPLLLLWCDENFFNLPDAPTRLATALATGGLTDVTSTHLPNLGIEAQAVPAGVHPGDEFYLPTPIDPSLGAAATTWILARP